MLKSRLGIDDLTILQVNRTQEKTCVLRQVFCKSDVRRKSVVTLPLSQDNHKIFCKSGPRLSYIKHAAAYTHNHQAMQISDCFRSNAAPGESHRADALLASRLPHRLWSNIMSSTKPEVHNVIIIIIIIIIKGIYIAQVRKGRKCAMSALGRDGSMVT